MARFLVIAATTFVWHAAVDAAPLSESQYAALVARFQSAVDAERARYSVPGITAAFVLPDGRLGKVASGYADVERKVRMTPDSRMLSGSTGKTLAAATAIKLSRQGVWSLDDKVSKYLGGRPWFQRLPNADALTIRLLLQHRGGLENYYNNPRFFEWYRARLAENPNYVPGFDTLIEFVCDQPPLFAPGQGFNYTDVGYLIVGLAMESATGRAYYDLARESFLDPLGLTLTAPSNVRRIPGLTQGYANGQNPLLLGPTMVAEGGVLTYDPAIEFTAGGFVSNAGDLARWASALYGGKALDATALAEMLAVPAGVTNARYYGLGAGVFPAAGGLPLAHGHDGYIPGYRTSMRYYPAAAISIALQVNTEDGYWEEGKPGHLDFESLRARITRSVLEFPGPRR
ncbi:serine hydrolase domain-containing protein [Peristeroidobacter soli]|uniref:serine hydrolase domain-containing protein n=1 Tax=Peristeroidobacter soli TaxID=2497877 RepID=UPI0013003476|nr:serine hydrolase domain-containing protein [Peristeroidobacter soli]